MTKASRRSTEISSFKVMDILEAAKELEKKGRNIVHFEVGEPEFKTPAPVSRAGIDAIKKGHTRYTHSMGTIELRKEICKFYRKEYGITIAPEQVIVSNGSSAGLLLTFAALVNKGDKVILGTPHYSCYPNYITFLGGKPTYVKLLEKEGFQLSPARVKEKITPKTKAILINSPSNPTGAVMTPKIMKELAKLDPIIVSDEIYHGLTYGEKAHTILEYTDNAFVLGGFSKRFAMTGWRIGYVIAPMEFIRPMQKVQQNFQISPNSIAQDAAIAALATGLKDAEKMRLEYMKRRNILMEGLRESGFKVTYEPEGAFYLFVSCRFLSKDSLKLAFRILNETGVAVTPGIDFGASGEGYLRFSYTTDPKNILEGIRRLKRFVLMSGKHA
ncbi:MAG: pyridoxal phosphate-dependent aminotransferase [Nitrospinota bacterium]|nr:pyridoxal phosphate-dependent aminotransferase [Nitrospinota bacterium]